jgi:chaperonin GroEL (HSP60 family)
MKNGKNIKKITNADKRKAASDFADVITSTMGGGGQLVSMVTSGNNMMTTKDGANIGTNYMVGDVAEDLLVAQIIDAATSSAKRSGDGTTLTTLLVSELTKSICPVLPIKTRNLNVVRAGMGKGLEMVMEHLATEKIDSEAALSGLIKTSLNGQTGEVLDNVISAVEAAGQFGNIIVKYGDKNDLKIEKGYTVNDIGIASQYYNLVPDTGIEIDEALVLIVAGQVRKQEDVIKLMQRYEEELGLTKTTKYSLPKLADGKRLPVIILTTGIQSEALTTLIKNLPQNNEKKPFANFVYQVHQMSPDVLSEIKTAVGVESAVGDVDGLLFQNIVNHNKNIFGLTKRVKLFKDKIVIVSTSKNEKKLSEELEKAEATFAESLKAQAKERIARLSGSTAELTIHSATTTGMGELFHRVEDAVKSGQNSYKGWFVRGGGVSLFMTPCFESKDFLGRFIQDDFNFGVKAVLDATKAPLKKIADNAGIRLTDNIIEDLFFFKEEVLDVKDGRVKADSGIIDSSFVIETAFENAIECAVNIAKHSYVLNINQ